MGFRLFLLFVVVPMMELFLLIRLGDVIGFWNTVLLVVATGLLGSAMARREGLSVWSRFNRKMAAGQLPGDELIDGLVILVSGALLITPGVMTDVVGFLGLFPPSRALLRRTLRRRFRDGMAQGGGSMRFVHFGPPGASPFDPPPGAGPRRDDPAAASSPKPGGRRDISDVVDAYRSES